MWNWNATGHPVWILNRVRSKSDSGKEIRRSPRLPNINYENETLPEIRMPRIDPKSESDYREAIAAMLCQRKLQNKLPVIRETDVSELEDCESEMINQSSTANNCNIPKQSVQYRLNKLKQQQLSKKSDTNNNLSVAKKSNLLKIQENLIKIQPPDSKQKSLSTNTENKESIDEEIDYERALHEYCMEKEFGRPKMFMMHHKIEYNTECKNKQITFTYGCKIKIGKSYYGGEMVNFEYPQEATQIESKNTLKIFMEKYGPLEKKLAVSDGHIVPERVLKLLKGEESKLVKEIPNAYRNEFKENLPKDWLKFIEKSILLEIGESEDGDQIIYEMSKDEEDLVELPPITLPKADVLWKVEITNVFSTIEIWGRSVEYNFLYYELLGGMELELTTKRVVARKVQIGGYYVIHAEVYMRVRVSELNDGKAFCLYIDSGEENWHCVSEIYKLDKRFRETPPQAICMQLSGLKSLAEDINMLPHLKKYVLNKTLWAKRTQTQNADHVSVLLYGKYVSTEFMLNSFLEYKIEREGCVPKLKENGKLNKVFISNISNDGEIYIQTQNETYHCLLDKLSSLFTTNFNQEHQMPHSLFVSGDSPEKIYLALNRQKKTLYRAKAMGQLNHGNVLVFFVDYGTIEPISPLLLFSVGEISMIVEDFPYQALKVKLSGLPSTFSPEMIARLRINLPRDSSALLKVIEPGPIPEVEIFTKKTQNDLLMSINNALRNELELQRMAEEIKFDPVSVTTPAVPSSETVRRNINGFYINGQVPVPAPNAQIFYANPQVPLMQTAYNTQILNTNTQMSDRDKQIHEYFSARMIHARSYVPIINTSNYTYTGRR